MKKNHLRLIKNGEPFESEIKTGPPNVPSNHHASLMAGTGLVLRHLIFMVLMFVRIPVVFVSRLIVGPLLFAAIAWGFISGWASTPTLTLAGAAFIFFLAGFAFDALVLAFAPEGFMLEL